MTANNTAQNDAPRIIKDFLVYTETIRGKSPKTTDEYFLDLRIFFRFMKIYYGKVPEDSDFDTISISDIDIDFIRSITLSDIYEYMNYLSRDRIVIRNHSIKGFGIGSAARARKTSSLRTFFKYLHSKVKLIDENPVQDLEAPKIKKSIPKHLNVDESISLLEAVEGDNSVRDYCIITLFLNCGLRVSELTGINMSDISGETLSVTGKGNKERIVYVNDACKNALDDYMKIRLQITEAKNEKALFISRNHRRISVSTVKWLVKKHLSKAGLNSDKYSVHKLRHTAATLMYQNGVDVRTLQNVLGHESLNTTRIYTHVSDEQVKEAINSNPLSGMTRSTDSKKNVKE